MIDFLHSYFFAFFSSFSSSNYAITPLRYYATQINTFVNVMNVFIERNNLQLECIVSYNNSFRILRSLPMRRSASAMFASSNVDSCQARIRRSIYSLRCRLDVSFNLITHSVINSDVHVASKLNSRWIATLYNLTAL